MTSEAALLNKYAIALAADSATTMTYWEGNAPKTRLNKIFNISALHPVGLMTFASANLQGVPWELVVKSYREYLHANSHDNLSGYAKAFFEFITTNLLLFPKEIQEKQFKAQADRSATLIIRALGTVSLSSWSEPRISGSGAQRLNLVRISLLRAFWALSCC